MTQPRLIGLCSPAMFSGKTTVADHLVTQRGFVKVSFATPLKMMTDALLWSLGIDEVDRIQRIYGERKEEPIEELGLTMAAVNDDDPVFDTPVTSRIIQQRIGTEFGRVSIRPSLWVDIAIAVARKHLDGGVSVVIDDMRFQNEYQAIQVAGGDCYRIVRPGTTVTRSHVSEGQLDLVAMPEIWNRGSVDDLYAAADRVIG